MSKFFARTEIVKKKSARSVLLSKALLYENPRGGTGCLHAATSAKKVKRKANTLGFNTVLNVIE